MCYIVQVTQLIVDYQNKSPLYLNSVPPGLSYFSLKCQCIFHYNACKSFGLLG